MSEPKRLMIKEVDGCLSCPARSILSINTYTCRELPSCQRKLWSEWWDKIKYRDKVYEAIYVDCPLPRIAPNPE